MTRRPANASRSAADGARAGRGRALRAGGRRLASLVAVQNELAAAGRDPEALLRLAAERAGALVSASGAVVALVEGDALVIRAASGVAVPVLGSRRPAGDTLLRYAVEAGAAILVADARHDPRLDWSRRESVGEESIICAPFFSAGGVIGALTVLATAGRAPFDEADLGLVELVAAMVAAAIGHATSLEAAKGELDALARFQAIFERAPIGIARVDPDGRVLSANPALAEMLGRSGPELVSVRLGDLGRPEDRDLESRARDVALAEGRDGFELERRYLGSGGRVGWARVTCAFERDAEGLPSEAIVMIEDVTERRLAEQALRDQAEQSRHQALHDALTRLPNRTLLRDEVTRALADARSAPGRHVAVMLMDLDRFKEVNDVLGHAAGDDLLAEIARRLETVLTGDAAVARLGGDEFAVLLPAVEGRLEACAVADRLREAVGQPVQLDELALSVEASVGVAVHPEAGSDVDTLLRHADVAMYEAKAIEAGVLAYDPATEGEARNRSALQAELRRAVPAGELAVHYQPTLRLASGEVVAFEALVRWRHPAWGVLPPATFLPTAQQSDLVRVLALEVIAEALGRCRGWREAGAAVSVAVNLSTRNLLDLEFPAALGALFDRFGLDHDVLTLEVTEASLTSDRPRTRLVLGQLAELGVRLSVDDFGTGSCSLAQLRRLPVSELKIDRSVVAELSAEPRDTAVVAATVGLGRSLGLDVVAEGIEDASTLERLAALGCDFGQGFYLAEPMPGDQVLAWLDEHGPRPLAGRVARAGG